MPDINLRLFFVRLTQYFYHRPKSWWRTLVSQLGYAIGSTKVPVLPTYLDAEPTNHCNQKCPGCATGDGTLGRPKGMMKSGVFEKIMEDLGRSINFTDLYCMGESFLNKNIYQFIELASQKGIFTKIDTNGIIIDAEKLLDSGLDQLNFHISGTTQEIHDIYRRGGDLENILGNIRKLIEARKNRLDNQLQIRLGMIVFKQNEHQIDDFFQLGRDLMVDEVYLIEGKVPNVNLDTMGGMLTTIEQLNVYDEEHLSRGILKRKIKSRCSWPWHGTSISWNGDVHPCCHDYYNDHKVGNILEQDFEEIWNGEKLRLFRQQLLDGDDIPMCRECPGYGIGVAIQNLTKGSVEIGKAKRVE